MKKCVRPMWRIHDVLFLDKKNAEVVEDGKETAKEVFVGIDVDFNFSPNGVSMEFFGDSWVFTNYIEAQKEVYEYNRA